MTRTRRPARTGTIAGATAGPVLDGECEREREEQIRRGRSLGLLLPVLPRHRVFLFAPADGGRRFADLFRRTWRRLPLGVRRRILRHWRHPHPLFVPLPSRRPRI